MEFKKIQLQKCMPKGVLEQIMMHEEKETYVVQEKYMVLTSHFFTMETK
jgi:hypothetical protein